MPRKAGRPSEKTESREKLIFHARELFMVMPYDKVSTRLVAERAGVNIAMIRYYFGSKEGLFETMVKETVDPIRRQMSEFVRKGGQENLIGLMRSYYKTMASTPQFPRLVAQVMNMPESELQRRIVEKILKDAVGDAHNFMFERLSAEGVLKNGADPRLCRVSFFSLMIFPFIAPSAMMDFHGVKLDEKFLEQLLEHNIKVIQQGFISSDTLISPGENNES